jgi:hypothetical protein
MVAAIAVAAHGDPAQPPVRIGRITIETIPIFNTAEESRGSFYRAANIVHVQTRAALIRRFLTFHEGDVYEPVRLAETERNLRLFDFLLSASVTAGPPHDGLVDVKVVTQDEWTSALTGDFSNDGGKDTYEVDGSQKDLFGTGSDLQLHFAHGVQRSTSTIELLDPALLGPYWNLDALYSKSSDGNEEKLDLERPLFSYATPWTGSLLLDHLLGTERMYQNGGLAASFQQEHRELVASRSYVLHNNEKGSASLVGGFDLLDDSFAHFTDRPGDVIPDGRNFRFVDVGYEATGFRFVKLDYIDNDLRKQDFNLGHISSFHLALSPPLSGRPATWRLRVVERRAYAFSEDSFVIGLVRASTRSGQDRDTIVSFNARAVTRIRTHHPQAFVARARLDLGWRLDRDVQFLADGQSGLRAYPDFAFEGSRRIILNAEHRLFLGRELLGLFGPGIAVFADSGQAVDGPFRGMKSDVGAGLRIGIARYDSALIRIDYAYALNASPLNRRGPVLSISTQQAF